MFKEVKDVIKHEVQLKELEKIEFELKEEESDSTAEEESEDEEPQSSAARRSVRERRFYVKTRKGSIGQYGAVFRYFHGTSDYSSCYQGRPGLDRVLDVCGFVDADWAGDLDQRRSTSGYVFNIFGGVVSWMSKKQSVVALSTIEAEYMVATHASKEAIWLQRLCSSMGLVQGAIRINCDSQSEIFLAKNPAYHSKTKHIDVQCHFVRDMIEDKKVLLVKMDTLKNTTNALKKSVSSEKFSWCRETMGISGLDK
eukprot:PITA_18787